MKLNKLFLACSTVAVLFAACNKDDDDNNSNLNDTDRNFMMKASYGNYNEIDAGSLASTKGNRSDVRSYGSMMVIDHTAAQNQMKTLATQKGVTNLPTGPDSVHVAMKQMMMNMNGRTFDTAYMNAQVRDHQATINLFQNEISNGQDAQVKNMASTKLPIIQHHYHLADSIARSL